MPQNAEAIDTMNLMSIRGWIPSFCRGIVPALLVFLTFTAQAQTHGPPITFPVEKVRESYLFYSEDGLLKNCGVRLFGEWPA